MAIISAVVTGSVTAKADDYSFVFTTTSVAPGTQSVGTITGTFTVAGGVITAVTGTDSVLGAIALDPNNTWGGDNLFSTTAPYVDFFGVDIVSGARIWPFGLTVELMPSRILNRITAMAR